MIYGSGTGSCQSAPVGKKEWWVDDDCRYRLHSVVNFVLHVTKKHLKFSSVVISVRHYKDTRGHFLNLIFARTEVPKKSGNVDFIDSTSLYIVFTPCKPSPCRYYWGWGTSGFEWFVFLPICVNQNMHIWKEGDEEVEPLLVWWTLLEVTWRGISMNTARTVFIKKQWKRLPTSDDTRSSLNAVH